MSTVRMARTVLIRFFVVGMIANGHFLKLYLLYMWYPQQMRKTIIIERGAENQSNLISAKNVDWASWANLNMPITVCASQVNDQCTNQEAWKCEIYISTCMCILHVLLKVMEIDTDCETKISEPLDSSFFFSSISETKYCNLAMAPSMVDEYRRQLSGIWYSGCKSKSIPYSVGGKGVTP